MVADRAAVWRRVHELRAGQPTAEENRRARLAVWVMVQALHGEGFKAVEIAALVGIHPATARRYLRLDAPPTTPGSPLGILPSGSGLSMRQIAARLGIDMRTVRRYLASSSPPPTAHGVPLRAGREDDPAA